MHDIAQRADVVVEAASVLDAEVLGHGDLDRCDVPTAPDRLEEGVREAPELDVEHRLLAEKVVDPQDLLLRGHRVQFTVELPGRAQVVPARLFDPPPTPRRQAPPA